MVALVSPAGTRVEVEPDLARVLEGQGWKRPVAAEPAPAKPARRPRKS